MKDVYLKRKLKYTEIAGVAAIAGCYLKIDKWGNIIASVIIKAFMCIASKINDENYYYIC